MPQKRLQPLAIFLEWARQCLYCKASAINLASLPARRLALDIVYEILGKSIPRRSGVCGHLGWLNPPTDKPLADASLYGLGVVFWVAGMRFYTGLL